MAAYGDTVPPSDPTPQRRALAFHVIIRTRWFDDYLLAAVGGCRQVVLLAAGLDTRAMRLAWPDGVRLFEVDLPELLEVKERVLADSGARPRCERVVVPADLTGDWVSALIGAGFDPSQPTAWLVEGLLVYLAAADAERVLAALTGASAPGSRVAFERGSSAGDVTAADTASVTALWHGGLGDPAGWLADHGWEVRVDDLAEVATAYGRPPARTTGSCFLSATR